MLRGVLDKRSGDGAPAPAGRKTNWEAEDQTARPCEHVPLAFETAAPRAGLALPAESPWATSQGVTFLLPSSALEQALLLQHSVRCEGLGKSGRIGSGQNGQGFAKGFA